MTTIAVLDRHPAPLWRRYLHRSRHSHGWTDNAVVAVVGGLTIACSAALAVLFSAL